MKIKRRNRIAGLAITSILAFALAVPTVVYASTQPTTVQTGGTDIIIEYRYTAGEEGNVNIPDTISRYGRTYKLKEKKPAVLESTLPATRTYSWSIGGFITEEQAEQLKIDFPGIVLTPALREGKESIDVTRTVAGLPVNDVELIPYTITHNGSELRRAAVQFEITKDDQGVAMYDAYGLPASYTAEVIYRGLGGVSVPGYYSVSQTYESTESLGDVAQYVIITTYSPASTGAGPAATTTSGGTGTPELQNPIAIGSLADDAPAANPPESTVIGDGETPQAAGTKENSTLTIILTILKVILIAFAAFAGFIGVLILRKKIIRARRLRKRAAYQWGNEV